MLTGMGYPLLGNSHSIIPNPKSLFNIKEVNITPNTNKVMKRKPKTISKEKAIVIASNHNNIPIQIAKGYTESELREVLRHLNLKPGF